MAEAAVRVALLARPGEAREQLRRALAELGADLVAEGDPGQLDPSEVEAQAPTVVLVSLEPAIEDALDRFDALLAKPGVEVMYDDAEVTRQLDGWDLARWARHLAAKLAGGDVLPPPPGGAAVLPELDLSPEPGAPPTPAQEMAHEQFEDYAAESLDLADWVPSEPSLAQAPAPAADASPTADAAPAADDGLDLDLDLGSLAQALGPLDAEAPAGGLEASGLPAASAAGDEVALDFGDIDLSAFDAPADTAVDIAADATTDASAELSYDAGLSFDAGLEHSTDAAPEPVPQDETPSDGAGDAPRRTDDTDFEFDASLMDLDLSGLPEEGAPMVVADDAADAAADDAGEPLLADLELAGESIDFSRFSSPEEAAPAAELDADVAALAAQLEALESTQALEEPKEPDFAAPAPAEPAAPAAAPAAAAPSDGAGKGSLFANLSLVPMDEKPNHLVPPGHVEGALMVLAGLGGPDAVRQLLAALPPSLPLPVLLYQHLDTGRHDRLVDQLGKASQMPVDLAAPGKLAYPGRVSVLAPGVGASSGEGNLQFIEGGDLQGVIAALPAAESGVLVLSGADVALVPAVLAIHAAGGLVMAQDPSACFDSAAAQAVVQEGAGADAPAALAARVVERWH